MPALPGSRIRLNRTTELLEAKVCQLAEIHALMHAVNCSAYTLKTLVVELYPMFRSGRRGTSSETQPGQAHIVARLETFAKMEEALRLQRSGRL
jgi:hypothetical protein